MRYFPRLLILFCLLYSTSAFAAYDTFIEPLYWRATETFDWVHTNNLTPPNLVIGFKAVTYNFKPGVRVGIGYNGNVDMKLYYTGYYTSATDSASGNLTTGFLGGRLTQTAPTTFYQTAQADYHINFNMIDWDIGKHFSVTDSLMLRPLVGLEGGVINQTFNTNFQNAILSMSDHVTNDFQGIGPKMGIESSLIIWSNYTYRYGLVADFETSYLWGRWKINEITTTNTSKSVLVNIANRNFGSLGLQGMLGVSFTHKNFNAKLGYEISDWLNQCQFFSDETGTQNNDLVLQGLTLSLNYKF
jgi:hypothetical protein